MRVAMEEDSSAPFIKFRQGIVHGTLNGTFAAKILHCVESHHLNGFVFQCNSGSRVHQPDTRLFPSHPGPSGVNPDHDPDCNQPYGRLVVKFEFGNWNASALHQVGHIALSNHCGTLFAGIKIWAQLPLSGGIILLEPCWSAKHLILAQRVCQKFIQGRMGNLRSEHASTSCTWEMASSPPPCPRHST